MRTLENYIKNNANMVIQRKNGVLTIRKNRFGATNIVISAQTALEFMDKYKGVIITDLEIFPELNVSDSNTVISIVVKNGTYGELYFGKRILFAGYLYKVIEWLEEKGVYGYGNTTLKLVKQNLEFKQEYMYKWTENKEEQGDEHVD